MTTLEERLAALEVPVRTPVLDGDVRYAVDDFAVGSMLLAVGADGRLLASSFVGPGTREPDADAVLARLARLVSPRVVRAPRALDGVRRELEEFLDGRRRRFDVAVDPVLASPFGREVLAGLAAVGYGRTTTYGALAAALGRPSASRAVGAALGANPLCVVLPCHRVVAASGALTGYAGGLDAKRRLLALEGALTPASRPRPGAPG